MNRDTNHTQTANERYKAIAKVTNDVIWDWDLTTDKLWWNEGLRNTFGYNEVEPSIESWTSKIHPHDFERVTSSINEVIANAGEKWSEEYRFLRADGTYAYVFDRGFTIVQDKKAVRMVGCMIDITEQKQLQIAKEETEEWMRFALDAAELGTWNYDVQSGVVKWDERCRELYGFSEGKEIKYSNILNINIHPDDVEKLKKAVADAVDPSIKSDYNIEFRVIGAEDKVERWLRCKGKAYFNEDGTPNRLAGTAQDITKEVKDRHEQDMLLRLVDNTPEFVAMATPDGSVIYLNKAGRKLVGIGLHENVHDLHVKTFYTPEFFSILEKDIIPALFKNSQWSGNIQLKHFKTGELIPCHAAFITINDSETGKILVRGVTMRDLRPEYAAQAEQLKLLTLVDNSVDLMAILRMDGKNSYINKAGKVLLGLEEDADETKISIDAYHTPEQIAFVQQEVLPNIIKNGRWSGRFAIKNIKTGEIIPLENNALRIDDINGVPIAIGAVMRDLRPELEAQNEQRRLLALLENTNEFVSLSDINGNVSYVNKAGLKMMGFDSLEDAKRHNSEYVMPGEVERVRSTIYSELMDKGSWSGEVMYRHSKTGEAIPVQGTTMMVYDSITHLPQGRATIARDLRPERAAQQALRESEQLFRNIATALPLILWMSDTSGKITFINQKWVEFLSMPQQDQFDSTAWHNAILEDDLEKTLQTYYHAMQNASTLSMEYRVRRTDGSIVWTYSLGQPQYDEQGTYTGFLGYTIDITTQKELQRQKDEFIGIASHELKTPVTSIKAYAQLLREMSATKGETLETQMLTKMDGQITKLSNLINDLLDVTKIQAGKLQFNDKYFDFDKMVDEVAEELQRTTNRHQIIRQFSGTGMVYGDEHRIGQVITNFLTNAIKYSPQANTIVVATSKANNRVQLSVQDFGIGIPEDNLDKVFEQFYRVNNSKQHQYPGLGLGLYISAEIIRREGGKIWVESTEGQGSTFCFSLPVDSKRDSV